MPSLRRRLPGINGLVTFEAAARHLNFTRAADELCVSQAAVSRQIRRLEEQLGATLFERANRAVRLTPAGRKLQQSVAMGLEHIANTAREIGQAHDARPIRIATTVAFATFWLMPRLNAFRRAQPQIDLHLTASDREEDIFADGVDISLTCGEKHNPGRDAYYLFGEVSFPVCSPGYLRSHRSRLREPADLLHEKLLHLDERQWQGIGWEPIDWPLWLRQCGVEAAARMHGLTLNNYPMLVQAAIDGEGIALGWRHLCEELLATGKLVRPIKKSWDSKRGFYLVISATDNPDVAALRDWLLANV